MIPIKIQCGCGQKYAFDAEPVDGRMGAPVACPACGADGTAAANEAIAQSLSASAAVAPAPGSVRVAVSAAPAVAAPVRRGPLPGQLERTQAEHEAHAKILWGDSPDEVVKFLMRQGIDRQEAQEMVEPWLRERTRTVRFKGLANIGVGIVMVLVLAGSLFIWLARGRLPMLALAVTIMIGLWGFYKIIQGIFMFCAPKSERGDVAEQ